MPHQDITLGTEFNYIYHNHVMHTMKLLVTGYIPGISIVEPRHIYNLLL